MVTTRPMIRLSGFSGKTSFDDPSLNSSRGCSSLNCPKRGSQQQLRCDCDCADANTLFRQQLLRQQQQQQHHHQRNHHVLLLQLQAQKGKKALKQPHLIHLPHKRPVYFPPPPRAPPPPTFRPTASDSNSESDREGLEHFHRHLQQLHRFTCASLENAIYFGEGPPVGKHGPSNKSNKVKSAKSFSFRDIRDIGKKKNKNNNITSSSQPPALSSTASSSLSSSPLSDHPSSSSSLSKLPLKRRNTTRTAKDYIGVSRVKLLAKYWNKGKTSVADSGNGGSSSSSSGSSTAGSNTSRSSDSGESQLSNYCSGGSSGVTTPNDSTSCNNNTEIHKITTTKINGSGSAAAVASPPSINPRAITSPHNGHKRYPINQNNTSGANTVTYKVRYDIPSSWESEQLVSFASAATNGKIGKDYKHDKNKYKNKGNDCDSLACSSTRSSSSSVASEDQRLLESGTNRKKDAKICTHCGRGPESSNSSNGSLAQATTGISKNPNQVDKNPTTLSPPKPKKTNIFKNLTFVRSQNLKPKEYSSGSAKNISNTDNKGCDKPRGNGKVKDNTSSPANKKQNLTGALSTLSLNTVISSTSSSLREKTMVQQKLAALGRSKSQKCPDRRILLSPIKSPNNPHSKLIHTNSVLVLPKNEVAISKCLVSAKSPNQFFPGGSTISLSTLRQQNLQNQQPKVRFKEQQPQHYRSEQCLSSIIAKSQQKEEKRNFEKVALQSKWPRNSFSTTVTHTAHTKAETTATSSKMLPDEKEYHSLYDCRIPRPKIRGIVPTHSYGVGSICSGPSSPVSRCSSAIGENRVRRLAADFVEFTEISLQDDDSETSGFESEQNNAGTTTITAAATTISKDDTTDGGDAAYKRKQVAQKSIPAEMTPAGKYFTDFKTLYHYQDQRMSAQKSPTPSRGLSFRKPHLPALLSRSSKKKGFEDPSIAEFLKSLPIFRKLNDGFFAKLSEHISDVSYENGNYIIRQGEKGDFMYFLVAGTAKATFKSLETGKSEEIFLKTLHPGDFFGEKAFQTRNGQYTYNVLASSDDGITCVKVDRVAYEELIYKCHEFKIRVVDRSQRKIKLPDDIAKIKLSDLRIVTTLGVGGFGRVELCTTSSDSSKAFALKKMKKCQIVSTRQIEQIRSEKSILLETNCDFICKLYKTYKDSKYLYMLMECCLGGELWTVLRDRGRFEDDTAKFYIGCVLEALKYLHSRNIIFRDLKPENLLLDSSGYCKLVDFGFAKKLDGRKTWTFCGTPKYCAPEIILNRGHDLSADFWSLGVLMYELLTGTPPFTGGDPLRTYKIILQGIDAIGFPPTVSKYALNLIRKLCRDNPAERLGAQRGRISDIKKHKWFDGFDWHGLRDRTLNPPIIPDVRGPLDFGNFDEYPPEQTGSPPDDLSGWDWDF